MNDANVETPLWNAHIRYAISYDSWELYCYQPHRIQGPKTELQLQAYLREEGPPFKPPQPLIAASMDGPSNAIQFLQLMLDLGWKAGLRPSGHVEKSDELVAVRYHLEDLRRLVPGLKP